MCRFYPPFSGVYRIFFTSPFFRSYFMQRCITNKKLIKMKTRIILSIFLVLAFILPGCVFSLYPLYTESDLVYDSKLEGVWSDPDNKEAWKFENLLQHETGPDKNKPEQEKNKILKDPLINNKTYLLTYTENGEARRMEAHLTRLDDNLFLDIFPKDLNLKNSFFESQFVPVHTYVKITITGNRVELYFLNTDFLDKLLEQNTIRIKYESLDNYKVITASTDELQKFIKKYANRQELFDKPWVLTKKTK